MTGFVRRPPRRSLLLASFLAAPLLAACQTKSDSRDPTAVDAPHASDRQTPPSSGPPGGGAPAATNDDEDLGARLPVPDLYDPDLVPQFELLLDDAAVAVLSSPDVEDKTTWVKGTFKFAGVTLADVGVRRKGSYTLRALPKKTSLKIKFNKFVKKQKLGGLEELTLNNNLSDHTFLEQRLSLHVFRSLGLPAAKANTAEVRINGEYYGVYTNVETPDETFLARVFGDKANSLYEAAQGADWLPGADHDWEEDVSPRSEPPETRTDLHALFRAVEAAKDATLLEDLEGRLHTTHFLRYSAAEAFTGQHDGYTYGFVGSHNYFVAGDTDGKFSLVPWSLDTTFVASSGQDIDVATPVPEDTLLARCRRSACWERYKAEMVKVLSEVEALDLVSLAKKWHAQIDTIARADPKREHEESFYDEQTRKMYVWIENRAAVVRTQLGLASP